MFCCFEGIDGSGKTTQAKLLSEYLTDKGYDVLLTKEPGGSEVGKKIREILVNDKLTLEEQFFLFMADRAYHVRNVIQPALDAGKVVICDRYHCSTVVYQAEVLEKFFPNALFWNITNNGVYPDLTIIIDVPAKVAIERLNKRNDFNILDRINENDINILRNRFIDYVVYSYKGNPIVINGNCSEYEIHDAILKVLIKKIKVK